MSAKSLIWGGVLIGSAVGGAIPMLWGEGEISFSSLILSSVGALVGIYLGYRLSKVL
ncbi:MAG: hypothetical protein WCP15_03295 [bacterium]